MRHTFTIAVNIEADSANRSTVRDAILSLITDVQDQEFASCEVLPGGREVSHRSCKLSVATAEADSCTSTAGWAVVL